MPEKKIDPKFNIHPNYNRVNIVNPNRFVEGGGSSPFLVSEYPFNELSGDAIDVISGINATVTGSVIRSGSIYTFNNTDISIVAPDNNLHTFTGAFSIETRIKFYSLSRDQWIVSKRNTSSAEFQLRLFQSEIGLNVYQGGTSSIQLGRGFNTSILSNNQFYDLLVSYDGSGNRTGIKIYIDGNEVGNYVNYGSATISGISNTTSPLQIVYTPLNPAFSFLGEIDYIRLFNSNILPS